jgi:hypothetical protein
MFWFSICLLLARIVIADNDKAGPNNARLRHHDSTFIPDFYLSVTYEDHKVACQHRMSVLVNGTSPGPALRLPAGKTSWVRVCNNMTSYNTTIVRSTTSTKVDWMLTEQALARPYPTHGTLQ